jgi:hypothetical protein
MVVRDQHFGSGKSGCVVLGSLSAVVKSTGLAREKMETDRHRFDVRPGGFGLPWRQRREYLLDGRVMFSARVPVLFDSQSPPWWQFDVEQITGGAPQLFPRVLRTPQAGDEWAHLGCITPTEQDVPCAPQAVGQQWIRVLKLGLPLLSSSFVEARESWDSAAREAAVLAAIWERMRYESVE